MHDAIVSVPVPVNEPVLTYAVGSAERTRLKAALATLEQEVVEIPCVVGGERIHTGELRDVTMPHAHRHVIARYHAATEDVARRAIKASMVARREWAAMRWEARAAVLLKAADLLAGPWRARLNAATMHGQSKTAHQAEIDAACELIDFWRFNAAFAQDLYRMQPHSSPGVWNMTELRALEGFVFAMTPFNFTAIAGNLPTAPALMGNVCVWKPAETQVLAAWRIYQILEEAGLPPGVINFIPGLPHHLTNVVLDDPQLAGVHFTGSTDVFRMMWKRIAGNLETYKTYPRLVGETGGKDFILAHASADPQALATAIIRGGFEYQGQKCSAASRVYVARSVWDRIRPQARRHHRLAQDGQRQRLLELHGRRDQAGRVRAPRAGDRRGAHHPGHGDPRRRRHRCPRGLVRAAHAAHHRRPGRPPHARRVLRPDRDLPRLPRPRVGRDARVASTAPARTR